MTCKKNYKLFPVVVAIVFLLAGITTLAASGGFKNGNNLDYKSATGDVSVQCFDRGGPSPGYPGGAPTGPSFAHYTCYGYSLVPGDHDYFVGPKVDADQVELFATRADGSTRSKTSSYDGAKGQSNDTFNLWIETLFQRPLLKLGRNDIKWTLTKDGRLVQTGSFISEVFNRGSLMCPSGSDTSWDPIDCQNSGRVCSDYFYRYGSQCR